MFLPLSVCWSASEYVLLVKVLDDDDKGIIQRQNGEQWLIEKGVGALSFWRFEGKQILIYSPGLFCGVGSKLILSDVGQETRIWSAEKMVNGQSQPSKNASKTNSDLAIEALKMLGYFDPLSKETLKSDVVLSFIKFQKEAGLAVTGKLSFDSQVALSNALINLSPQTLECTQIAFALLLSAKSMMSATSNGQSNGGGQDYSGIGSGHWIQRNIDSGSFILLEDGSIWEIDPLEKIDAILWLPISNITVIQSSKGSVGYNYLLINADDGEKAHAKYIGRR